MKLRNAHRGMRVAIRENVVEHGEPPKKVNTYDLIIPVGKGKTRAMLLAHAIQKFLTAKGETICKSASVVLAVDRSWSTPKRTSDF